MADLSPVSCADENAGQTGDCDPPATCPASVLCVSGDDPFRTTLRAYLEHVGYRVCCCADVARVPELFFRSQGIDLLLIDVHLLGSPGLRLAAELTAFAPGLPVVVICAASTVIHSFPATSSGGWRFLRKPVGLPDLLETVRAALEQQACPSAPVLLPFPAVGGRVHPDTRKPPERQERLSRERSASGAHAKKGSGALQ